METLLDLFQHGLTAPKDQHLKWRDATGSQQSVSSDELRSSVAKLGQAMLASGLVRGERVAIMARNSGRWAMCDYGAVTHSLVLVPLYPTLSPSQVVYILEDSGARILFLDDAAQFERVREQLSSSAIEKVVIMEGPQPQSAGGALLLSWDAFLAEGEAEGKAPAAQAPTASDLATIIYTSGTTGNPKGVMLSHSNLVSNARACIEAIDLTRVAQVNFSLLPLCHIFQRLVDYFLFLGHAQMVYCSDPLGAVAEMAEVKPTFFAAVPRLFEKVHAGVLAKLSQAPAWKQALSRWALAVGKRHFGAWYQDGACKGRPGPWLNATHWLAERLVLSKIRAVFGGRIDQCFSGGAALPPELHAFFRSTGLEILPGYGLTETSPVISTNVRDFMTLGSAGRPLPGVSVKLAEDHELLVSGPLVMQGYWRNEEATAATMDGNWLKTGDLARIDGRGYIFITGRKKEILVLSTGKNVSPLVVESCCMRSDLVSQIVVVGDGRKYVTALVHPNSTTLVALARKRGMTVDPENPLTPETLALVLESITDVAQELSSFERPKAVAFLPRELTLADLELTPTLKLKRRVIMDHWGELVDALYTDAETN